MANKPLFLQSSFSPTNEQWDLGKTKPGNTISGQKKSMLAETWHRLLCGSLAGFLPLLLCLLLSWLYTSSRQCQLCNFQATGTAVLGPCSNERQTPKHWRTVAQPWPALASCCGEVLKIHSETILNYEMQLLGLLLFPLGKKTWKKTREEPPPMLPQLCPPARTKGEQKEPRGKRELHLSVLTLKSLGNLQPHGSVSSCTSRS